MADKRLSKPGGTAAVSRIWMFTREYAGLAGAGGVKDVAAQLSRSLARWNRRRVSVVLPLYGFMDPGHLGFEPFPDPRAGDRQLEFSVAMNYTARERRERVRVWFRVLDRVRVYLLEAERFREKNGVYTYTREEFQRESWKVQGSGHFDYFAMNILLQKAGLSLIIMLDEKPDIIHCHDGHTAVVPAIMRECEGYRHYFRATGSVVTIHNAGIGYHQEVSDLRFAQAVTGLPWQVISSSCLEHSFDPFIAAGGYASITTVSQNYAKELQETDHDYLTGWLGHRLKDRGVKITGITNGIDPREFDTRESEKLGLAAAYDPRDPDDDLVGKAACKEALLRWLRVPSDPGNEQRIGCLRGDLSWPLFAFIGRLSDQKGIDILIQAARRFLSRGSKALLVCLGNGAEPEELALQQLALDPTTYGRCCFLRGFNTDLANRIYAAGDFFVIPSRYEPCGLTDYIALLFGTLPVVHHVGGLIKVEDGKTGFAYTGNNPENLQEAMTRAQTAYTDRATIRRMQLDGVLGIDRRYTWNRVMKHYLGLYRQTAEGLTETRTYRRVSAHMELLRPDFQSRGGTL